METTLIAEILMFDWTRPRVTSDPCTGASSELSQNVLAIDIITFTLIQVCTTCIIHYSVCSLSVYSLKYSKN